jgi:hypothetical protein
MEKLTSQLAAKGSDDPVTHSKWFAEKLHGQEMKAGIIDKLIAEKMEADKEVDIPF